MDDEDDFRQAAVEALREKGFAVTDVRSGEEAIRSINREKPDVILPDLDLPDASGIETLQKIREVHTQLPIIILTGPVDFDNALAAVKPGITDFPQKPFNVDRLGAKILKLIATGEDSRLRERTIAELMVSPIYIPKYMLMNQFQFS